VSAKKTDEASVEDRISGIIDGFGDWRGATLGRLRDLIREAVPDVVEELKWAKASNPDGVPTWSSDGIICTGEVYKSKVKLTFMHGAEVDDPAGIFNTGFGGTRRAIDLEEGDEVDAEDFKALVRRAAERNAAHRKG
jgi:hypothetical protein